MEYTYPDYYEEFHCTADRCPDTCCAGWQICIDKKSLKKYLRLKGPFGNRLKNSIDRKESCFYRYQDRCALLNDGNLCDICLEIGEEYLCKTCAEYPRHTEEYENVREVSLSLSCPEAATIMLSRRGKTEFVTQVRKEKEENDKDFDFFLYTKLSDMRKMIFDIIQNRELSMANRMAVAAATVHDLQRRISSERLCDIDAMLERFQSRAFTDRALQKLAAYGNDPERRYELIQEMLMTLHELERLQDTWRGELWNDEWLLYGSMTKEQYIRRRKAFLKGNPEWEIQKEQLLVYFVYTYFCGAVYDGEAYRKLKMCEVHILLLEELLFALWLREDRSLPREKMLRVVYRYAREVEHSDWNLEYMEQVVGRRSTFSLTNMLTVILSG